MFITLIFVVLIATIIVAANLHQSGKHNSRRLVNGMLIVLSVLGMVFGFLVLLNTAADMLMQVYPVETLSPEQAEPVAAASSVGPVVALFLMLLSFVIGVVCIFVVVSLPTRLWIGRVLIRSDKKHRRYNPYSMVHTVAIVLALIQILNVVGGFILVGGIEGLAAEYEETGLSYLSLLTNLMMYLLMALLGVGLFIRRNATQTMRRLGLLSFHPLHLLIGAIVGFLIFWLAIGTSSLLTLLLSPEQRAAQSAASEQLFLAFSGSLFAGFMLALTAAIGEEILFRGALQPIFGLFWTSIFFALMHAQYTLTPAALVIFGVSMLFGWLRRRFDTSTAIMAHFVYNFLPFLLLPLLEQVPVESLTP